MNRLMGILVAALAALALALPAVAAPNPIDDYPFYINDDCPSGQICTHDRGDFAVNNTHSDDEPDVNPPDEVIWYEYNGGSAWADEFQWAYGKWNDLDDARNNNGLRFRDHSNAPSGTELELNVRTVGDCGSYAGEWADYADPDQVKICTDEANDLSQQDRRFLMTHELGHSAGLIHRGCNSGSIMVRNTTCNVSAVPSNKDENEWEWMWIDDNAVATGD